MSTLPNACPVRQRPRLRRLLRPLACRRTAPASTRRRSADALALQRLRAGPGPLPARHLACLDTPAEPFTFDPALRWLGLEVRRRLQADADHAAVEFVARSKLGGRAQRLHEVSRFAREAGRWFYVDGELK